ncbi:MAG: cytochrome c3 family protein, partial [candidate division Zixibacteria bacterium]|nr:cytochrome c3 family protein [candidate division Zixibacteria bacterium]
PAHDFTLDVHSQKGLGCQDCHGGDPTLDDMDKVRDSKGWQGVPKRSDIPSFCARCHSSAAYMHEHNPKLPIDQLEKYETSVHGQRLYSKGDQKVATCVSCHTAHRIGDAAMPHSTTNPANIPATCGSCHSDSAYMAEYGIPTDQEKLYRTSVHGNAVYVKKDLSAPVCNDCHGNHGAAPPGTKSLSAVCGTCHAIEAGLYSASPHKKAFEEQGLPMCETCHSNHGIERPSHAQIGLKEGQLCGNCHSADDGTKAPAQIDSISAAFTSLTAVADSARQVVNEAGERGMMITDEEFAVKEIDQTLIHMRSLVHNFTVDSLLPQAKEGIEKSRKVRTDAAGLIDEYYFRRWGLGIASGLITLLAVALWLKIRALDKTQG